MYISDHQSCYYCCHHCTNFLYSSWQYIYVYIHRKHTVQPIKQCNVYSWDDFRSSHRRCSVRKGVHGNFAKCTGKHLCQSLILFQKLWQRCFPKNFANFLRTSLLQDTSGQLLLWFLFSKSRNNESSFKPF